MKAKRRFSDDILAALRKSKGLRIRVGSGAHRFIGIWAPQWSFNTSTDQISSARFAFQLSRLFDPVWKAHETLGGPPR
jgi:hypothetical protein